MNRPAMPAEFHYRIPWRVASGRAGHHAGMSAGGNGEFQGYVPFASQPDPRHLDFRAMLADPLERWLVKSFRQPAAVPVYVLADLSASMGFVGQRSKLATLAEFAAAAAWSAWRTGDPFGLFAGDSQIRWELALPLRWHKGLPDETRHSLQAFQATGNNADALTEAALLLGRQRALVFLVSDFHWPLDAVASLLNALARHDVVPVVLWDSGEYAKLPRYGWAQLQDPETGQRRRLWLRPGLAGRIRQRFAQRQAELTQICTRHGREPFFVTDGFEADAMTRYFLP